MSRAAAIGAVSRWSLEWHGSALGIHPKHVGPSSEKGGMTFWELLASCIYITATVENIS